MNRLYHRIFGDTLKYPPLDDAKQSIRLIEILPRSRSQLACRMHAFEIDKAPKYVAMSYAWGPPEPTKKILVNGQTLTVRENLWDALEVIRDTIHSKEVTPPNRIIDTKRRDQSDLEQALEKDLKESKYFWIDAICINQENILERNHQVGLMGDVYSQAFYVLIWLGPDGDGAEEALHMLNETFEKLTPPERTKAFEFLLSRDYWTRLWVVQEILRSKRNIVMCGRAISCLEVFDMNLRDTRALHFTLAEQVILYWSRGLERIQQDITMEKLWDSMLFELAVDTYCQDPRDRIYGLLGLVPSDLRCSPDAFVVDYSESAEQLLERILQHYWSHANFEGLDQLQCVKKIEQAGAKIAWLGSYLSLYERQSSRFFHVKVHISPLGVYPTFRDRFLKEKFGVKPQLEERVHEF